MKILKEIPIHEEMLDSLKEVQKMFVEYYGRESSPDEPIFAFAPIYNDDYLLKSVNILRKTGMNEREIYAFYKTNGLMPSEFNLVLLSNEGLSEYNCSCKELDKRMNSLKKGCVDVIQYVLLVTHIFKF